MGVNHVSLPKTISGSVVSRMFNSSAFFSLRLWKFIVRLLRDDEHFNGFGRYEDCELAVVECNGVDQFGFGLVLEG